MHVYVWEHIVSLYHRTASWMFTKFGRDEVLVAPEMHVMPYLLCIYLGEGKGDALMGRVKVLIVPYKSCCFSARSLQGRIQGGAK